MKVAARRQMWDRLKHRISGGLLACGLLATASAITTAQAQQSAHRSVNDVRPRIPDELDRPVRRETSSHRGFEIREDQFTIAANTTLEDARWAAAEVAKARREMALLADRFTSVHRAPDFGLNSLQVVIDGNPPRDRDAPQTTISVAGFQTQAMIHVSPGMPTLREQRLRLRQAAAFAMLHAAEADAALPPWVVSGLAAHVAVQGQPTGSPPPGDFAPRGQPFGGYSWQGTRTAPDQLEARAEDTTQAAHRVTFLLAGNDAEHAPAFFEALRHAQVNANSAAGKLNALFKDNSDTLAAWLKDNQLGQPVFDPEKSASPELVRRQREMLVVLKLQRRLADAAPSPTQVKVVAFKAQPSASANAKSEPPPLSPAALAARLNDSTQQPLATLDADGNLLVSTDRRRIRELLGWDGQRYRLSRTSAQWVLETRLGDGRLLHGWLEGNPDNPTRPVAKFAVLDATVVPKVDERPSGKN